MTPQEKAKQLIEQFDDALTTKDCALICVDEIIENYDTFLAYWQEVKKEIQNL